MTPEEQVAARITEALDKTPGSPTLAETSADYLRRRRDGLTPDEAAKIAKHQEAMDVIQKALGDEGIPDMPKDEFNAKFLAALEDPLVQTRMSMYAREYIEKHLWLGSRLPLNPPGPITLGTAEYLRVTDMASCPCGKVTVTFDPMAARGLSANEVRKRWPRGQCQDCNAIVYASSAHYIEGDW